MTSGLSGSPAPSTSRRPVFQAFRSSWISMRQTVGGAQKVVTPSRTRASRVVFASNRAWSRISTQASASQGVKKQLQACLAQPGDEMFRWMSPGCSPIQ